MAPRSTQPPRAAERASDLCTVAYPLTNVGERFNPRGWSSLGSYHFRSVTTARHNKLTVVYILSVPGKFPYRPFRQRADGEAGQDIARPMCEQDNPGCDKAGADKPSQ